MDHDSQEPINRFPRLATGDEAAAFKKLLWTKPNFHVKVKQKPPSVEFSFEISFPAEMGRLYPPVKFLFFGAGARGFEGDLSHSYWEASSGKEISRFISNLLHLVFQKAIDRWLERSWKSLPSESTKQMSAYRKEARKRRGRQPDPILALWVATRLKELRKMVRAVRKSYKRQQFNEAAMWRAAERIATHDVLCLALKRLVSNQNIDALFVDKRVTENRIVLAILRVELDQKSPEKSKHRITLQTYLKRGEELRLVLTALPKRLHIKSSS